MKLLFLALDHLSSDYLYRLVEEGKLPAFKSLLDQGAHGSLNSSLPAEAPIIWQSILTGQRAYQHAVLDRTAIREDFVEANPISNSPPSPELFESLQADGYTLAYVNCPRLRSESFSPEIALQPAFFHHPPRAEDQCWSVAEHSIIPRSLSEQFKTLRVSPHEIDSEVMSLFVTINEKIDQTRDDRLQRIAIYCAHLFSIHNCALTLVENNCADLLRLHLPSFQPILEYCLTHREAGNTPFDRMQEGLYRLIDLLLGTLLSKICSQGTVAVVSPSYPIGSAKKGGSPELMDWAPPRGLLILKGPAFRPAASLLSAHILDVYPTLNTALRKSEKASYSGRILVEALVQLPQAKALSRVPAPAQIQLKDLPREPRLQAIYFDRIWLLLQDLVNADQTLTALPIAIALHKRNPTNATLLLQLFSCYLTLYWEKEATRTLKELLDVLPLGYLAAYVQGELAMLQDRKFDAQAHYQSALQQQPGDQKSKLRLAQCMVACCDYSAAETYFSELLEDSPGHALAYLGLAQIAFLDSDWTQAARWAFEATKTTHNLVEAHLIMARSFGKLGMVEQAEHAYQHCLGYDPYCLEGYLGLPDLRRNQPDYPTRKKHYSSLHDAAKTALEAKKTSEAEFRQNLLREHREQLKLDWD